MREKRKKDEMFRKLCFVYKKKFVSRKLNKKNQTNQKGKEEKGLRIHFF